ncbi:bestrophin family protein [Sphingobacterium phlebotomi]|uniref:bestrophin family protein n=1 Tax=Sphingobacterium phlebotomi TaxID=2605433 RepID=UPI001FE36DF6|nr:bestrophin family protein [Sphingobacterium phlebotomi]
MILNSSRIPLRYMLNKVKREVTTVAIVGLFFNAFTYFLGDRLPDMPLGVPAFLGTAISVLLSFKMSQSYERWWEARKIWGAIVNDSRSLVIQLQNYIDSAYEDVIREVSYKQIAWCYALGDSLRGLNPLARQLNLTPVEQDILRHHKNVPLGITQMQAARIKEVADKQPIPEFYRVQLDQTLVRLVDSMGRAERINTTVFPVTYRFFLHAAIYLFLITLSIAIQDVHAIFEIPLLVLIAALFFLAEKTAYNLQDPFRNRPSDTPVTAIARNIEINIKQLLKETEIPEPLKPKTFFIL